MFTERSKDDRKYAIQDGFPPSFACVNISKLYMVCPETSDVKPNRGWLLAHVHFLHFFLLFFFFFFLLKPQEYGSKLHGLQTLVGK